MLLFYGTVPSTPRGHPPRPPSDQALRHPEGTRPVIGHCALPIKTGVSAAKLQGIGRSQDLITIFGDQFGGGHFGSGTGDHGRNRETRTEIITAYSRDTCIGCIEGFANHRNHARNVEGRLHIIRRATPIELLRRCDTLAIGCAPNPADTMPTRVNVPNRVIPDITVPVEVLWVRAIRNNTIG